ncbi:hypothetical protein TeGR_g5749 [Tetraparma gracilis]|uniref:Fucoxanthin chlorophyll a/c protein n=1 Tax=Tetraparma gracilis TaxID=2962635 RepID=A0ABQ6MAL2_9STRA|nr:hypothetical protein TeGR_g5749 [Tetraparma gracilis]
MLSTITLLTTLSVASAFDNPFAAKPKAAPLPPATPVSQFSDPAFAGGLPGQLAPAGAFDPFGFTEKATPNDLLRYREAEVTHGRVAMLATIGFLAGEAVEGSSFLFDAQITGPAITHLAQVPPVFWTLLAVGIGASEQVRAETGWVAPKLENKVWWQLQDDYAAGDIGFDPLGLKPEDPAELEEMITKELQHGRLAMLAAAGMCAQELVDGKGIIEHFTSSA